MDTQVKVGIAEKLTLHTVYHATGSGSRWVPKDVAMFKNSTDESTMYRAL